MERPAVLTREARLRDDAAAREAVRSKEAQLGLANKGDLSRDGRRDEAFRGPTSRCRFRPTNKGSKRDDRAGRPVIFRPTPGWVFLPFQRSSR